MKYIAGVLGFLAVMSLYWIGGGEFERSPIMAYFSAVAVIFSGVAYSFYERTK